MIFFWWNVKDNKGIWWLWPFFTNFCKFGVFLSPNQKYPKNDCFKKGKIEWIYFYFLRSNYFKYHMYHSDNMILFLFCMFVLFFCSFSDFHIFQYCEKCVPLNAKSQSTPLRYGLGAKKPILAIFGSWTPHSGTKLCLYQLIFHVYNEENCIET